MPAAAVIPAPLAYTKVVAVKKLVVGFLFERLDPAVLTAVSRFRFSDSLSSIIQGCLSSHLIGKGRRPLIFYFEEIRALKADNRLNALAWNNKIRLWHRSMQIERVFCWFGARVMIDRNDWGC